MSNSEAKTITSDFLDVDQVCDFLNLKKSKLRAMIFKKQIPVVRLGRCLRFSKQDLIEWINSKKNY